MFLSLSRLFFLFCEIICPHSRPERSMAPVTTVIGFAAYSREGKVRANYSFAFLRKNDATELIFTSNLSARYSASMAREIYIRRREIFPFCAAFPADGRTKETVFKTEVCVSCVVFLSLFLSISLSLILDWTNPVRIS